jgi:hypothetical protein
MQYLRLNDNDFDGDLSGWTLPAALGLLFLYVNSFSGDLSGWSLPAGMTHLYLYGNSFSGDPDISSNTAMRDYRIDDNGLIEADVDAILLGIYTRRAAFTFATPALKVGGTNATPSGIYQDGDPPTTGLEYVFEIANDPEAEGFNTWSVTYNGGTAP